MPRTATYNRDKMLNVRKGPSKSARVVRRMRKGDSEEFYAIEDGWVKLRDGWAMAEFLEISDDVAVEPEPPAPEPVPEPKSAPEPVAEPEPAADDGERAVLRKKTVAELRDIAEQSGIAVKKGAKKEEIIDALLSDD